MKTLLLFLCASLSSFGQTVMFSWDINTETNVVGYRLLSGPASRIYTATNVVPGGRETSLMTMSNVPSGRIFFALVAMDASGLQSDFSNEVLWTNRSFAPRNFRLVGTMQASASPTGPWKDLATVDMKLPPMPESQQFYRTRLLLEELP